MIAVRPVQMNNKVIFAAAGNGKTYSICSQARSVVSCGNKCALLISYTNQGVHALESEYKKQNYGVLDEKIVIKSWYSFLLSEFIKPYQCTLKLKDKRGKKEYPVTFPENFVTSIAFYETEPPPRYFNQTHVQYFVNRHGDISPDRTSHLAYLCNEHSGGKVVTRMEEIYSHIFIDELQDYAGWDLEIIRLLFESKIQVSCVGDYKQATYRTNNSPKNRQYRDENIRKYFTALEQRRLCTVSYENTTRRFHQEICDFINTIHNDADSIVFPDPMVNQKEQPDNIGVYLIEPQYLSKYCEYYKPIILRYAKNSKIDFNHECEIINYGGSKGATYNRVLIIPVSTVLPFIKGQSLITSNQTRSKFYVACTRAKHSIAFAVSNPKESKVFRSVEIKVGDIIIPAFKFVTG